MARVLLEDMLDAVAPAADKRLTKKRVVVGAQFALAALTVWSGKKPGLAPFQQVLSAMFLPSDNDVPEQTHRVIAKIKKLKSRLATLSVEDIEHRKVKHQLEVLFELLTAEEG